MAQDGSDWTEPGLFTVAPGVHRIPLPLPQDGLRAVNVYAIESGDDLVLIDGGWALADSGDLLAAALGQIGRGPAEITRCLVTHVHRDHYTMAVILRRRFGTQVALGIGDRASLASVAEAGRESMTEHGRRLRLAGAEPVIQALRQAYRHVRTDRTVWEQPDEWLKGPVTVSLPGRDLLAVPTPGHTQGHLVFADTSRAMLFAGDHVLPHITPSVGFEPVVAEQPLGDYLRSLRLMLDMPDMRLLPAHGPVAEQHPCAGASSCSPITRTGSKRAWTGWPLGRTPRTRPRRPCRGPGAGGGSPNSTRSTRCWPPSRPASTWTCWPPRGGWLARSPRTW